MTSATPTSYPLVSVVVATYNGARFIREQLESIVDQTYSNLEIIIVDDNSQDETVSIVQEYTCKYRHITLFESEQNLGFLKNFERGVLLTRGDFVALSDQDDIWLPEKIAILMHQREGYALVYCNSELIDAEGKSLGIKLTDVKNLMNFDSPLNYTIGGVASGHAMLVKRGVLLESLPWPHMVTHDYWIGFVATFTSPLKFVDKVLVLYRQHEANVVGITAGNAKATCKKKKTRAERNELVRERIKLMYEKCPEQLIEAKHVFRMLNKSYAQFSLKTNFIRMITFLKYRQKITAYKKRGEFRKILFCLKMFVKIE